MTAKEFQEGVRSAGHSSRPRFRLRGLRAQIVLWTVLPVTLVLIGVAFTGVYSHEQAMRALVQERDRALAFVSAVQIQGDLQQRVEVLRALAAEQVMHHPDPEAQKALLHRVGTLNDQYLSEPIVVDESGALMLDSGPAQGWAADNGIVKLARQVMESQNEVLVPAAGGDTSGRTLLVGVPIVDESGATYGVLVGLLSTTDLQLEARLSRVKVGEKGAVYLVDKGGQILVREPTERARQSLVGHTGLDVALQEGAAGATLCVAPDGERMTLAYAPIDYGGLGWRMLIEQPWAEVVGPVLRYSQFVPLVMVLAVIVSLLALYYGVRSIVRPLQLLGQQMERVAWGDFEAIGGPVGGVAEIEEVRRSLDQMAQRIQAYQRGMHDYIAAITHGQEEERRRLARELHDDTVQALIALNQRIEMAQKLMPSDPERVSERLAEVRADLAEAIEGVRRFSRDLRPIYLEDLGFIPALEMLAREADGVGDLTVHFSLHGQVRRLPSDLELAAFRIVQEALNNVLQHAGAKVAVVAVRFGSRHLSLSVRDDGRGFEVPDLPDVLAHRGHFGLMGIKERALLYGGQLALRSDPDGGTEVSVQLPYPALDIPTPQSG